MSAIDVFEAAKEIWERDDPDTLRSVISTLRHGERVLNRTAAAYALNLMHGQGAIPALENAVRNKGEHPKVRGQAAESLAHNHRKKSHGVLLRSLTDPSKEVRFWCAYSLAQMGERDALGPLRKLAATDHRMLKGFWSVSREAKWAIRTIQKQMHLSKRCLFCSKTQKKRARKS
jgi:HEAT repeat protein